MTQQNLRVDTPVLKLPCGEGLGMPSKLLAELRGSGISKLHFPECSFCGEEHFVLLRNDLTAIVHVQKASGLVVPVPPNKQNGASK